MTAKERNELLTAGCQMARSLENYRDHGHPGDLASAGIALERWNRAYAAYRKRVVGGAKEAKAVWPK
jgi:hypothetical protein